MQKITKTTLYINYYQSQKAELQNKIQIDGAGYRNGERGDLGDHKLILCKEWGGWKRWRMGGSDGGGLRRGC